MSDVDWDGFSEDFIKFVSGRPKVINVIKISQEKTTLTDKRTQKIKELNALKLEIDSEDDVKLERNKIASITSKRLIAALRPILEDKELPIKIKVIKVGEGFDVEYTVEKV